MLAFKIKFSTAFIKCFENKSTKKKLKPKEKTHTAYLKKKKNLKLHQQLINPIRAG